MRKNKSHKLAKLKMKIVISTIFTLSLLPVISTNAKSTTSPIIHIVTEHLPPYQIVSENKPIFGFAVDIIKETMARSHFAYSLKSYPWVRSYKLAQVKANHCIFSIARLKSRENLFKWVGPISQVNNTAIWAQKGKNIHINTLEDAKNYTIAVNRDDIGHTGLVERGFLENTHLYILDDAKSLVNVLLTRPEIDLIVADDTTISFRAELVGANINELQRVFEIQDLPLNFFFACSKSTDDETIVHLAKQLESVHKDGTYNTIWEKWRDKLISAK